VEDGFVCGLIVRVRAAPRDPRPAGRPTERLG
jgi:hypothetical protein